jgi:hypothetical protein
MPYFPDPKSFILDICRVNPRHPACCYLSYGETPLVNYGPWSNFLYIFIAVYFYLLIYIPAYYYLLPLDMLNPCLQQTGEIDNLIVSWEQSSWLCCV